jgi:hypothetical protein
MVLASTSFSSGVLIGNPRHQPQNPFTSRDLLPNQRGSYLRRLLTQPPNQAFGFGDHITAPITRLEAQFSASIADTVSGLFSRIARLQHAAAPLLSGTSGTPADNTHGAVLDGNTGYLGAIQPTGVFARRTTSSTDGAVTATAVNGATLASYAIDVQQLATSQQNVGDQLLSADSPAAIAAGVNTFSVTVNGVTQNVSVTVAPGDTNLTALDNVAAAVNAAQPGVYATVQVTNDVAQLVLTGMTTGASAAFSVADVSGNVVSATGVAAVSHAAQDATVSIDGITQTFAKNQAQIDPDAGNPNGRVQLTFHAVTLQTATVDVAVALDAAQVVDAAHALVSAVDDLRAFAADKPDILSQGLLQRFDAAMDGIGAQLAAIGIQTATDGTLIVDNNTLQQAIGERPQEVEETLGGATGFAARQTAVANTVLGDSATAFATRPGPLGDDYGRFLIQRARLDDFLLGRLFVDVLV